MSEINERADIIDFDIDNLFDYCIKKNWKEILRVYHRNFLACKAKLTTADDTALHIILSLNYGRSTDAREHVECVCQLLDSLPVRKAVEILSLKNDNGNTPLHLAAAGNNPAICGIIASYDWRLIMNRNLKGETPMFLAAQHGKTEVFLRLQSICARHRLNEEDLSSLTRRHNGDTILHSAIAGEYFKLAYKIISYYPRLVFSVNEEGFSPLHILARKPSAFLSSSNLRVLDWMIYRCIFVETHKKAYASIRRRRWFGGNDSCPGNYQICMDFIRMLSTTASCCLGKQNRKKYDEENMTKKSTAYQDKKLELEDDEESEVGDSFPPIYATCIQFYKVVNNLLFKLGIGGWSTKAIWEMKKRHAWAIQVMNELIDGTSRYKYKHDGRKPVALLEHYWIFPPLLPFVSSATESEDKKKEDEILRVSKGKVVETPILVAAKMGIKELVEKIIKTFPVAIQDKDAHGKNALLLTAEYRQTKVFDSLIKMNLPEAFLHQVDDKGNSALHLAAMFEQHQPQPIPGVALLMQWEIKWYEHVRDSIPLHCYIPYNGKGETAVEIFTRTHQKLAQDENDWLMKTSESCSVVAALIASVAYATSSTVPGGFDQTAGYPLLENQHAFHIYSVTSVLALCFSVTALVFFLAILTSRSRQRISEMICQGSFCLD